MRKGFYEYKEKVRIEDKVYIGRCFLIWKFRIRDLFFSLVDFGVGDRLFLVGVFL